MTATNLNAEPGNDGFQRSLSASGCAAEIPADADLYGWLIGNWELEVLHYGVDVRARGIIGEVHFSWVLEGRAVQDVWIMPRRSDRGAQLGAPDDRSCNMYGTTLRIWDATRQAWRVTWLNPVVGQRDELIGGWSGGDIVQLGSHADGTPIRWRFLEIADDSFRWLGEALQKDGHTWKTEGEFRARRLSK